jgi:hypothetical protein
MVEPGYAVSFMLTVVYADCHKLALSECHYAEHHYAERHYAECHYAECHYAVCLGPICGTKIYILAALGVRGRIHNTSFYSFEWVQ